MFILLFSFITSYNQPTWGIDNPIPELLNHGEVFIHFRNEPIQKLRAKIGVGIWNSIFLGISYGGDNLVGYDDVEWEEQPSLDFRIRLLSTGSLEGVIGFNNEPIENYASKGAFGTIGLRFFTGPLRFILSGGGNYNTDLDGADLFANMALNINGPHTFHMEYILGSNDDNKNRIHLGYRLQSGALGIQMDLKDIFSGRIGRQLQIYYRENF